MKVSNYLPASGHVSNQATLLITCMHVYGQINKPAVQPYFVFAARMPPRRAARDSRHGTR